MQHTHSFVGPVDSHKCNQVLHTVTDLLPHAATVQMTMHNVPSRDAGGKSPTKNYGPRCRFTETRLCCSIQKCPAVNAISCQFSVNQNLP